MQIWFLLPQPPFDCVGNGSLPLAATLSMMYSLSLCTLRTSLDVFLKKYFYLHRNKKINAGSAVVFELLLKVAVRHTSDPGDQVLLVVQTAHRAHFIYTLSVTLGFDLNELPLHLYAICTISPFAIFALKLVHFRFKLWAIKLMTLRFDASKFDCILFWIFCCFSN